MTTPEELDALPVELSVAQKDIISLRARVYELEAEVSGYREWGADVKRLTRQIDVEMHGEEGAAKQASLCDLVGPARELRERATAAEAELARRGQGVQVNLVWEDLDGYAWRATAPLFGSFRVERYSNGPWQALWSVPGYCAAFVDGGFATAEDAKQAIEARIRAALVSPGDGCACGGKGCSACDPVSHCQQCGQFRGMDHACPAPPASEPSEYEKKVAQMKEDFPNGI